MRHNEQDKTIRERGAATVEYALLIGGVVIMMMVGAASVGATTSELIDQEAHELADNRKLVVNQPGTCPNGWDQIPSYLTKKTGKSVDNNGDGMICRKQIPGLGNGNTNLNQNVKDNN